MRISNPPPAYRFEKGKSGNPGGATKEQRAKQQEVKNKALEHCPRAIEELVALMGSNDPRVVVVACNSILDRGLGKPAQALEIAGEMRHRHVQELTDDELADIAAGRSSGIAAPPAGAQNEPGVH